MVQTLHTCMSARLIEAYEEQPLSSVLLAHITGHRAVRRACFATRLRACHPACHESISATSSSTTLPSRTPSSRLNRWQEHFIDHMDHPISGIQVHLNDARGAAAPIGDGQNASDIVNLEGGTLDRSQRRVQRDV